MTRGVKRGPRRGGEKEGDTGVRREVLGARMRPSNPPPRRGGTLRAGTRQRVAEGHGS